MDPKDSDDRPLSLETLKRVGELLPDGVSVVDAEGIHLAVNDPFCAMVGYSREELLGSPPLLYWPEEEREAIQAAFEASIAGDFDHFQLVFKRANGERFPVIVSPNVVRDASGEPAFYFATVKDISAVIRAQDALEESEERYRTLADSTPYGIAVHVGGVVRYANRAALEILGATAEDVVGEPITRFIHPDDRELAAARVAALARNLESTPWARERFRRLDGTVFHADVAGARIRFEDELGVQVAFRDVSKELERERLQAQSNRLEAIGRLAGGVAHDFNNLLTVVLGACGLVLDHGGLPPDLREGLQSASEAASHGAALTRHLLAFSRQEPIELTRLQVDAELQRILPVLDRMVGEDVSLELDVSADCWAIRGDRTQLERVLLNLVTNARDAMPTGGSVRIGATNAPGSTLDESLELPESQDFVRIEVRDEGVGMDEETRAQVFEPFFTTRRGEGGSGLGLATVYGIVIQSGGAVAVDSKVGEGTTIHVLWPRASREASVSTPPQPKRAQGVETILLVEDQDLVRRITAHTLEREGYTVLQAEGYTDAMAWLESESAIDLLLTDVVLKDRNGPAIVADALAMRPSLPVVFMSGFADGAYDLGEHRFLPKPFQPAALSATVREALDRDDES